MRLLRHLVAPALLLLIAAPAGSQELDKADTKTEAVCRTGKEYRTLAEKAVRTGKRVLAIDADGRVLLLSIGEGGRVTDTEPLGYEQQPMPEFPFLGSLPKDQALMMLRRVSCADGKWKIWAALTIGFEQPPRQKGAASLVHNLLVFREPEPDDKNPVLAESFREVVELTVDDVNGDQRTELVVQYTDEDANSWMKLWQVHEAGKLRIIALDNLRNDLTGVPSQIEIGLGDYRHGGELLFTEQRIQTSKGWHVTRRYYDWDDATQKYELSEVVQSDEIINK
ncbi:MAG TPA: hypothetical protein VD837_05775 [Terriglobales bacterium]|nr:hypothetical protein [Terriglobales bacterium]